MAIHLAPAQPPAKPGFVDLFTPKLVTVLREGYRLSHLRADMVSGLTVAIVALPLSMAIAIASGATPAQGLITSIVGAFLVSALGGSRFQMGGPAGAFIVLVSTTVHAHGMDGLLLAVLLSGLMLAAAGFLRLGTYVKFIPYPVTVGFTAGIAVIIFASQIKDLLGLTLAGPEPGPLLAKLPAIWNALPSFHVLSFGLSAATVAVIVGVAAIRPQWPAMLFAVAGAAALTAAFKLPVHTIGSVFGGIPSSIPPPSLPHIGLAKIVEMLPSAVSFTLLGAIESLLSAVVADGMTGRRHRSNCELVAQGVANVGSALFGGICVTGNIARTATNIRAGAHGPVSGMLHSLFLLLFVLIAAPLASYIPLASLAGVLAVVAWNMVEKQAVVTLLRVSRGDAAVLIVTFGLTIFRSLTEAIMVGFALGAVLFIHRMSVTTAVETDAPFVPEDQADGSSDERTPYDDAAAKDRDVVVFRISGAFFFGAVGSIGPVLDRVHDSHRVLIIDFAGVPFVDSSAAHMIEGLVRKALKRGVDVRLSGASRTVRHDLMLHGLRPPSVHFESSIEEARAHAARRQATHDEKGEPVGLP